MSWRVISSTAHELAIGSMAAASGLFLQSPEWGGFMEHHGTEVRVLGYEVGGRLVGLCQALKQSLPFGKFYWFVPKGPIWTSEVGVLDRMGALQDLPRIISGWGGLFVRLEPDIAAGDPQIRASRSWLPGYAKTLDSNPRATSIVGIGKDSNWPKRLHSKTRYNWRLGIRHGLRFSWGSAQDVPQVCQLMQETSEREGFRLHSPEYYGRLHRYFGQSRGLLQLRLGLVHSARELLAAHIVICYGRQATYLHGASSRSQRELMAPYVLHGETMARLAEEGIDSYDLWGVEPGDGSLPEWRGFTRFKLGWGGAPHEAVGTYDYTAARSGYRLYTYIRQIRRIVGRIAKRI